MYRLFRLIQKEFLQLRRDPRMFAIMLIAPVIQLIIIGYAATTDVNDLELGVCDLDRTEQSRTLITAFTSSDYFILTTFVDTPAELDYPIARGDVALGLVIPKNFGRDLLLTRSPQVQVLVDGSDATSGTIALGYSKAVIRLFSRPFMQQMRNNLRIRNISLPAVQVENRAWFNPELKSRVYMVPAGVGLVLLLIMIMLTAMALVKEREIGTMEQLIVTPIRGWELLLGKIIPFILVGIVAETVVVVVAIFVFHIPLHGHISTLYFLSFGFFFTTLGLGILISTLCKTQQQAMLITAFFIMLPFVYLSGFVFPIENMPELIQLITYLIPLRYFLVIARGVFLKGSGWFELWDEFAIMVLLGIIIFIAALLRFKKKLD
ncbi:ABC transporter permease [candidate division CSSED10-310 bacterium]|uniref:ABC transporter permease n=1 Tax=candidate division CSSED10-310 bacterium TaxID=2855610 RepID=A0ABV6YUH9_UNCC1